MKSTFCVVFAAVAIIATIAGKSVENNNSELVLISNSEAAGGLTPEQTKCIQESVKQIVDDNPELDWWWDEVAKSREKLAERAKYCKELPNEEDKQNCWKGVRKTAKRELARLVKLLPPEERPILVTLKEAVAKCLKND